MTRVCAVGEMAQTLFYAVAGTDCAAIEGFVFGDALLGLQELRGDEKPLRFW